MSHSKNQFTDVLETLSFMIKIFEEIDLCSIIVETHDRPIHCHNVEIKADNNSWYHDIKTFLKDGSYLESTNSINKRTLRKLAWRFFLNDEILYKMSSNVVLLRCIGAPQANKIMSKIREGSCRPYMSRFTLARKILRRGYYWLTMKSYCLKLVRTFHTIKSSHIKSTSNLL